MSKQNEKVYENEQLGAICKRFMENSKKFYLPGWLTILLNHEMIPEDYVFSNMVIDAHDGWRGQKTYDVFGKKASYDYDGIIVESGQIVKPKEEIHSATFERIFKFGPSCEGFTLDRTVIRFPKYKLYTEDKLYTILENHTPNQEMLKFLLWLSVHGGFSNNIDDGLDELNNQLAELIGCETVPNPLKFVIPFADNEWLLKTKN